MSATSHSSTAPSETPRKPGGGGSRTVSLLDGRPAAPSRKRRPWARWVIILAATLAVGTSAVAVLPMLRSGDVVDTTILTYAVQPVSFDVKYNLAGELKAIQTIDIRSQVEGTTTILTIVPNGTFVKKGDVLITLASDAIKDRLEDAKIRVENAQAAEVNADTAVKVQEMQNASDLEAARINKDLSAQEYKQFIEIDNTVELSTRETALENAKTDLERRKKDLDRVKELAAAGFVSDNDVLDATIAHRDAKNKLETAEMNLKIWKEYQEPKQRQTLKRKMDEASAEFQRSQLKAQAALRWREADLRAKRATLRVETNKKEALEEQLAACEIKAPQPGMVVYPSSGNWRDSQSPIEEGAQVRQNQVLIQLPNTQQMLVDCRVPEALVDRMAVGQTAAITVDAIPGKAFSGKVTMIGVMHDASNSWRNPNLKEYPAQILMDQTPEQGKPAMTARAQVLIAQLNNVLAVPPQAVFVSGGQAYVFVGTPASYAKRNVKIGQSSTEYIEIVDGLKDGDEVLLGRPSNAPEDAPATGKSGKKGRGKEGGEKPSGAAA